MMIKICAAALIASAASIAIKKYVPSISAVLVLFTAVIILSAVFGEISPVVNELSGMIQKTDTGSRYGEVLIKTVGICCMCRFTSDSCKDMGEQGLAAKVELASKAAVAVLSLPLIKELLTVATGIMGV